MSFRNQEEWNGKTSSVSTQHAAAIVVSIAFLLLILIRRGFRGLSVPGVASLKVAS